MPDFDGNGLLKRGRIIGRELGSCKTCDQGSERRAISEEPAADENRAE